MDELLPKIPEQAKNALWKIWKTTLAATTALYLLTWCTEKPIDVEKSYITSSVQPSDLKEVVKDYKDFIKDHPDYPYKLKPLSDKEYKTYKTKAEEILYFLKIPWIENKLVIVSVSPDLAPVLQNVAYKSWIDTTLKIDPSYNTDGYGYFSNKKDRKPDLINYDKTFSVIDYMDQNNLFPKWYKTQHSYIKVEKDKNWDEKIKEKKTTPLMIILDNNRLWKNNHPNPDKVSYNISPVDKTDFPSLSVFQWKMPTRDGIVVVTEDGTINEDLNKVLAYYKSNWINNIQIVKLPTSFKITKDFKKFQKEIEKQISNFHDEQDEYYSSHWWSHWGASYYFWNSYYGGSSYSWTHYSWWYSVSNVPTWPTVHYAPIVTKYDPYNVKTVGTETFHAYKTPGSKIAKSVSRWSFRWWVRGW